MKKTSKYTLRASACGNSITQKKEPKSLLSRSVTWKDKYVLRESSFSSSNPIVERSRKRNYPSIRVNIVAKEQEI